MGLPDTHIHVETERLLLRPFNFKDAEALSSILNENESHLKPWIPFAKNIPTTKEAQMTVIRKWLGNFMLDIDYVYGIFDRHSGEILGGTGLHTRQGRGILEIGYWLRKDKERKGIITEAAREMEKIATHQLKAEKIEIRCEPENHKSIKVAERLGFEHDHTFTMLERNQEGKRKRLMVWVKFTGNPPTP